ncbi:fatty acyl-AMP ligase [Streptomyces mirabilis]|uniref:fatty acyl-AMP ligase n=1 Tax=Streptomyces mirabilis TaxID=68239 RepID=UPI003827376E
MMDRDERRSLLDSFLTLSKEDPGRRLFTYVDDRGRDTETLTAGTLAAAAAGVAQAIHSWGLGPGERVLLLHPPGPDFVKALVGSLMAGVIPVPVCPPNPSKLHHDITSLCAIAQDCVASAILTTTAYARAAAAGRAKEALFRHPVRWPDLPTHRTDGLPSRPPQTVRTDSGAPALLQYTSGSTGTPKGVMITHANLWHEVISNARDLGLGPETVGAFWLPQYHDFGLISVILSTLAGNGHSYLMSPLTFLGRPSVWFDVLSRTRATHTAAPNFAFELAVRRTTAEQRSRWDLSALRAVMSAAEPIRPTTVDRFFQAFEPSGLRPEAFYPAYGLAEHTVSVTMGGRGRLQLDRDALSAGHAVPLDGGTTGVPAVVQISCGRVTKEAARVRIVDPVTRRPCAPGEAGEIWVDSPTKAAGYWGRPEETALTFRATVEEDGDSTEYLRTGDLGFFHEDELYVTGRYKDVVIIGGHNIYPQDIEESVRTCHHLVRLGGVAAFGVPDPAAAHAGERLVLFVETSTPKLSPADLQDMVSAVRRQVYENHGLGCDIVVGTPGLVRKTTSGKVRRAACREAYTDEVFTQAPTTLGVYPLRSAAAGSGRSGPQPIATGR